MDPPMANSSSPLILLDLSTFDAGKYSRALSRENSFLRKALKKFVKHPGGVKSRQLSMLDDEGVKQDSGLYLEGVPAGNGEHKLFAFNDSTGSLAEPVFIRVRVRSSDTDTIPAQPCPPIASSSDHYQEINSRLSSIHQAIEQLSHSQTVNKSTINSTGNDSKASVSTNKQQSVEQPVKPRPPPPTPEEMVKRQQSCQLLDGTINRVVRLIGKEKESRLAYFASPLRAHLLNGGNGDKRSVDMDADDDDTGQQKTPSKKSTIHPPSSPRQSAAISNKKSPSVHPLSSMQQMSQTNNHLSSSSKTEPVRIDLAQSGKKKRTRDSNQSSFNNGSKTSNDNITSDTAKLPKRPSSSSKNGLSDGKSPSAKRPKKKD